MILAALLVLQERVELKEHRSHYWLAAPADYGDGSSWPLLVELHAEAPRSEGPARKALAGWRGTADRGFFVLAPQSRSARWGAEQAASDAAFLKACLDDAKSRYRVDPLRVLVTGEGAGADYALDWSTANRALVSGCFLRGAGDRKAGEGAPPVLPGDSSEAARAAALAWFRAKAPPRSSLEIVQDLVREGRWLDASLVGADLMERPDWAPLARFQMSRVEGEGLMALGKVELAMVDRRYLDAYARCREAAVQFAWVPAGEKARKRLAQLETDPRVRAARQLDD